MLCLVDLLILASTECIFLEVMNGLLSDSLHCCVQPCCNTPPTASSARAAMFVLCEESNTVSDLKIKQRRKITEKNKLDDVAVKIESSMKIFRSEKNLEIIRRNI